MSVRPPQSFYQSRSPETGFNILEYELMGERAASLGRNGSRVEDALARLAAFEAGAQNEAERENLLYQAADAVWAFFIQREICGLRDNRDLVRRYGIPKEVLAKVGVVRP